MKLTPNHSIVIASDATATTTEPTYSASWSDRDGGADSAGSLTGATPVTVISGPNAYSRSVEEVLVFNADTVSHTITVSKSTPAGAYGLFATTLGAGESMALVDGAWRVYTTAGEVKASTLGSQSSTAGAKNGSTVTASETSFGPYHQTLLTCTATPITIADDAGVAQYGGVKLYTLPEGLITMLSAVIDGSVTLGTTGTIINTWAGGVSLGTAAATTGATLTGTEADWMAENDVSAATAKVAVVDAVSAAVAIKDGTGTAKDVYLNLVVDDDASHTGGTGSFTGTVRLTWAFGGDK